MQQLIKIGKLGKLHGLKGDLTLHTDFAFKKETFLFIELNHVPTPFFISEIKKIGKSTVIRFDSIKNIDQAKAFVGKEIWADEKVISQKKKHPLAGYTLKDTAQNISGTVEDVVETKAQKLLVVMVNGHEVLLPFVESFIEKTDAANRLIYYKAPEGMFDL